MIFLIDFPSGISSLFSLKMAFASAQRRERIVRFYPVMQKAF
jgi:hypothetical protein